jgi:hypothetical protein
VPIVLWHRSIRKATHFFDTSLSRRALFNKITDRPRQQTIGYVVATAFLAVIIFDVLFQRFSVIEKAGTAEPSWFSDPVEQPNAMQ